MFKKQKLVDVLLHDQESGVYFLGNQDYIELVSYNENIWTYSPEYLGVLLTDKLSEMGFI